MDPYCVHYLYTHTLTQVDWVDPVLSILRHHPHTLTEVDRVLCILPHGPHTLTQVDRVDPVLCTLPLQHTP